MARGDHEDHQCFTGNVDCGSCSVGNGYILYIIYIYVSVVNLLCRVYICMCSQSIIYRVYYYYQYHSIPSPPLHQHPANSSCSSRTAKKCSIGFAPLARASRNWNTGSTSRWGACTSSSRARKRSTNRPWPASASVSAVSRAFKCASYGSCIRRRPSCFISWPS